MRSGRVVSYVAVLLVVSTACGRSGDASSERVVASPVASPTAEPEQTQAPSTTEPAARSTPRGEGPRSQVTAGPAAKLADARIKVTRVASMSQPTAMATRRGDSALYIVEKGGRIRPLRSGKAGSVVLDISSEVSSGGEQGLLGLAFHPDGKRLYVNFTNTGGDTVIREYAFSGGRASDPRTVLEIDQPFGNHNGGNLLFGPDGYLYIGTGDGGSGGDPQNNAQNLDSLLGKMLRIDPRPSGTAQYTSPEGNPFIGRDGRDEIWAYGLRNPWRYSFDRDTEDLWIGDVGQNQWEEINFARKGGAGAGAGDNYGWRRMEGMHRFGGNSEPSNHHGPIYEYANDAGNCAVTGGYVYRGSKIGALRGAYVFADYCAGRLRAFVENGGRAQDHRSLGPQVGNLASFGEAPNGDLYVLSLEGGIYRIDPA